MSWPSDYNRSIHWKAGKRRRFGQATIVTNQYTPGEFRLNIIGGGRIASSTFGQQLDMDVESLKVLRNLIDHAITEVEREALPVSEVEQGGDSGAQTEGEGEDPSAT